VRRVTEYPRAAGRLQGRTSEAALFKLARACFLCRP
jgi:hypothetical protein